MVLKSIPNPNVGSLFGPREGVYLFGPAITWDTIDNVVLGWVQIIIIFILKLRTQESHKIKGQL